MPKLSYIIEIKILRIRVIIIALLKHFSHNSSQKHHVHKKSLNKYQDLPGIGHLSKKTEDPCSWFLIQFQNI